ncbi:unnamed protein product [Larinioides sclopetarius]|uniref:Uncharacterized protein n=1 Tax=Larinioides sclopetarius TaxID=280406 RepID=A0AAV2C0T8_9ARAC
MKKWRGLLSCLVNQYLTVYLLFSTFQRHNIVIHIENNMLFC